MTPKKQRPDAAILEDIRRLRQTLERRKTARLKTDLAEARREIERLRGQLPQVSTANGTQTSG